MIPQLSARDLAAWRTDAARGAPFLLDVREPWEFAHCHIDGSHSIPLGALPQHVGELPRDAEIVVICHHGNRSQHAASWLARSGFERVHNLAGGVAAWAADVDRAMPTY